MSAQAYVIKSIKKGAIWKNSYGDVQGYAMQLEGIGEPVKVNLPLPIIEDPEVGDNLYGRLFEEKTDTGRKYYTLKLETRPETDLRSIDIHAQVAVKLAVGVWSNTMYESDEARAKAYKNIGAEAVHFAKVIEDVKKELLKWVFIRPTSQLPVKAVDYI